jgi:hypothetical protein
MNNLDAAFLLTARRPVNRSSTGEAESGPASHGINVETGATMPTRPAQVSA